VDEGQRGDFDCYRTEPVVDRDFEILNRLRSSQSVYSLSCDLLCLCGVLFAIEKDPSLVSLIVRVDFMRIIVQAKSGSTLQAVGVTFSFLSFDDFVPFLIAPSSTVRKSLSKSVTNVSGALTSAR
jgi:hypothetical protein